MTRPTYTLHEGSSVPSVPPQFTPSESFVAKLNRFRPESSDVSRSTIIRLMGDYRDYTETLRSKLDAHLSTLSEVATRLSHDDTIPSDAADKMGYVVARLKQLRSSPAVNATEDLPTDPVVGNYQVRLAQHYPEQPDIDQSSPRARIRSVFRTVCNDTQSSLAREQALNREALYQLSHGQSSILGDLSVIHEHLSDFSTRTAGLRNQPLPQALGELQQHVVELVDKLKQVARQFSGLLELEIDCLPAASTGAAIAR